MESSRNRKSILVAGSAPWARETLGRILSPDEYEIRVVGTIAEGLERLSAQSYAAVLIDPELLTTPDLSPGGIRTPSWDPLHLTQHIVRIVSKEIQALATIHTLVDTAPIGLLVAETKTGRFTYVSPATTEIFGEPVTGSPDAPPPGTFRILYPDGTPIPLEELALTQSMRDGIPRRNVETIVHRRDGSEVTILANSAAIHDARGGILGAVLTLNDITELKGAEKALRLSEEKYRRIVETANEGIWMTDAAGITTFANTRMAEMLGYVPSEIIGRRFQEFVEPGNSRIAAQHSQTVRKGKREKLDLRLSRKDGSVLWALISANPLFDEKGRFLGILSMVADITQRKLLEEERDRSIHELKEVNEMLQLVNATATDFLAGDSLQHTLDALLATARKLIPAGAAAISIFDSSHRLRTAAYDLGGQECHIRRSLIVKERFPELARKYSQGCVIINDPSQIQTPPGHIAINNMLNLGVRVKDGWAHLGLANKLGGFAEDDARKLGLLAQLASIIIDRARLDEGRQRARNEARRHAAELQSVISSMADGVALLDTQADIVWINEAGCEIFGIENARKPFGKVGDLLRYTLDGEIITFEESPLSRALRGITTRDMRYVLINHNGERLYLSVSASPVKDMEGRITGATMIFRDIREQINFERQREEQYHREHHISDTLQQALTLVHLPNLAKFAFAARYEPASDEAQVGGDFYDVFHLTDGRVALLMGDVAGQGLQAAVYTAMAKYMLRAYANEHPEPGHVLERLNRAMCDYLPADMFITLLYGVLDPTDGTLTCANAGHEEPLYYDSGTGTVDSVLVRGHAIGLISGSRYESRALSLSSGDMLLLYTDGIPDSRAEGCFLGTDGVTEALLSHISDNDQQIVDAIVSAAAHAANGRLRDDAAVLLLRAK